MKRCHWDAQLDATFHGAMWVVTGLHAEPAEGAQRSASVHISWRGLATALGARIIWRPPPPDMNAHDQGGGAANEPAPLRAQPCRHLDSPARR